MANDLQELRKQIDQCDSELLATLAKRVALIKQVGRYKQQHSLPPLDQKRWAQAQQLRQTQAIQLNLNTTLVHDIFELIHNHALHLEDTDA